MKFRAALILACLPSIAYADRVVVLRVEAATEQAQWQARVEASVRALGHESVGDVAKARAAVQDGVPDSSSEYVAAGKSVGAQWTLTLRSERARDLGARVEATVCQVSTGRTEFLARDVHGENQEAQLQEVLSRLLRSEGIGAEEVIWKVAAIDAKAQHGPASNTSTSAVNANMPAAPRKAYGEERPLSLGAGMGLFGALVRPDNARGSSLTGTVALSAGYTFIPSLEGRLNIGFSVLGPSAFHADVGARVMFPIVNKVYAGPELTLGIFRPLGGDQTARFLARPAGVVALALHPMFELDALAEFLIAPGGSGSLILGGGTLRGNLRL